ncbi:cytochrome c3 family protein [Sulfuriflexus sp.]|uniref:cytochrome c3 family protein n=1 Tax=Sulfuriflexus sp. TaxID=2015443 RepID=UPI0028CF94F8|nr:cytochrome c3 family protein [Sulfuriflexus sp.]MDT8405434.1 cytochrome c3 family protein [Sulfuriflexus sp.]
MNAKHVHTPLAQGDCSGCHNPHASNHGMLLDADADSICYNCHDNVVPEGAVSSHQVAADGNCVSCHDPHSSDNPANLVKGGSDLCFDCHKELGEKIALNKFGHSPVKKNCLTCHNPHASANNDNLLKAEEPAVCLNCHKTSSSGFKLRHMNYPVEQARCSTCHDPHGSNSGAILADNVHEPIRKQMCNQCHNEPGSAQPFAVKKAGFELCQGCHYDMINEAFAKNRLHWPLVDETGCINCHTPHASSEPGLLRGKMADVCGSCHADTLARQDRSQTKHQPISDGECSTCHSPHASNNLFLQEKKSTVDTCAQCHDWQTHSTHPIGPDVIDPRNRNVSLDCLSCHRTHGTEYKHFLYYQDIQSLCVQCHTKYRR